MKKCEPLVSIVIPVYNGSNYLKEAIDSALNQTYQNVEIIVVNDGSTDDGKTSDIAKSYGNKIRYYEKQNGGVSTALNFALKIMKGKYFSWLSHDDLYYKDKIKNQIDFLNKNKLINKNVILYSNYDVINENGKIINYVHFERYLPNEKPEYALLRGLISGISLLIPKSAFKEYGSFDEQYRCVQDYLLFFEFMKSYKYIFVTETTTATRVHSKQVTNCSPKLLKENNFLWTKMQKDISDKRKIELEGTLIDFYDQMYLFLIKHNNYLKAQEYSLNKSQKIIKSSREKLLEILKKFKPDKVLEVCNNYDINNNLLFSSDKILQQEMNKLIKMIGYNRILKILKEISNPFYSRKYNSIIMKNQSKVYKKKSKKFEQSFLERVTYSIKNNGLKHTFKRAIYYFKKTKVGDCIYKVYDRTRRI